MKVFWLFSLILSGQVWSQSPTYRDDSRAYVGFRVGYIEVEDVDRGNWGGGIQGGVRLVAPLWLDASVDYHDGDVQVGGINFVFANRESLALQLGLMLQSPKDRPVKPFLIGGVGYFIADYYGGGFYADTDYGDGGYFAGGGLEWFPLLRVSAVLEARWLFTQEEEFAERRIRADGIQVTLGMKFRF